MNRIIVLICTCLVIGAFFLGRSTGVDKAENQCKKEVIIQTKEIIKIQNKTNDGVIKSKKIREDLRFIDRDVLIDKL